MNKVEFWTTVSLAGLWLGSGIVNLVIGVMRITASEPFGWVNILVAIGSAFFVAINAIDARREWKKRAHV